MTTQPFAINTDPVLVVAPMGPFRDALRKSLKGIGFAHVKTVNSIQDAVHLLETEPSLPFWIVTTPSMNDDVNALQLLTLLLENEDLRPINVSLFFDTTDDYCIPLAFELGLLSAHQTVGRVGSEIDRELKTLVTRAGQYGYDMCVLAGQYLREHLLEKQSYANLLDFERALSRIYPKSAEQLILVAEALFRIGRQDEGRSCLLQARQMRPALAQQATSLYKRFAGEEAAKARPLESANVAEMFAVTSALVVDADPSSQTSTEVALKSMGVEQIHAMLDSDAALQWMAQAEEPGLIVMEWKLEGSLSGPAFLQRLRQRGWCNAPVVVVISLVNAGHRHLLREIGVALVIEKPLGAEDFSRQLVGALRSSFFPTSHKVMLRKVEELLATERVEEARRIADQLIASRDQLPTEVQSFLEAKVAYGEAKYETAHHLMVKLVRMDPDNLAFQDLLGKVLLRMGEHEAAVLCFKRADSVAPDNIERICAMAEASSELGDFDLAEERIGNARTLDRDSPVVLETEVKVGVMSKNFEAARTAFANLTDANVLLAYMNNRAVAFARSGRHDQGIELYADTLKIIPDSKRGIQSILYYNMGLAHIRKGDLPGALPHLTEAGQRSAGKIKSKVDKLLAKVEHAIGSGETFTVETPAARPAETDASSGQSLKGSPGDVRCHGVFVSATSPSHARVPIKAPRFRKRPTIRRGSIDAKKTGYAS